MNSKNKSILIAIFLTLGITIASGCHYDSFDDRDRDHARYRRDYRYDRYRDWRADRDRRYDRWHDRHRDRDDRYGWRYDRHRDHGYD